MESADLKAHTFKYVWEYVWFCAKGMMCIAAGLFLVAQYQEYQLHLERAEFEALPFEHFVNYHSITPVDAVAEYASTATFISDRTIENVPRSGLRIDWDEVIQCDMKPYDNIEDFGFYSEVNPTGRRYSKSAGRSKSTWTAHYRRHDGYNGANIDILYPGKDADCRLLSVMTMLVGGDIKSTARYSDVVQIRGDAS